MSLDAVRQPSRDDVVTQWAKVRALLGDIDPREIEYGEPVAESARALQAEWDDLRKSITLVDPSKDRFYQDYFDTHESIFVDAGFHHPEFLDWAQSQFKGMKDDARDEGWMDMVAKINLKLVEVTAILKVLIPGRDDPATYADEAAALRQRISESPYQILTNQSVASARQEFVDWLVANPQLATAAHFLGVAQDKTHDFDTPSSPGQQAVQNAGRSYNDQLFNWLDERGLDAETRRQREVAFGIDQALAFYDAGCVTVYLDRLLGLSGKMIYDRKINDIPEMIEVARRTGNEIYPQ